MPDGFARVTRFVDDARTGHLASPTKVIYAVKNRLDVRLRERWMGDRGKSSQWLLQPFIRWIAVT